MIITKKKISFLKDRETIDIRLNKINLHVLIRLIFSNKKINFFNYIIEYLNISKCKLLITFNDNLSWLYKIKIFMPSLKLISIQNGLRSKFFFDQLKKNKLLSCDYIFTFNESYAKQYKQNISTKTHCIGSFLNNSKKINKKKYKQKIILFVASGWQEEGFQDHIPCEKLHKEDTLLVKNLYRYCKLNNYKFAISSKLTKPGEYSFYKKILKTNDFSFFSPHTDNKNVYELSDRSLVTVSSHSTVGFESLSRGNRTAMFNNKDNYKYFFDFFWYLKLNKSGIFWSHKCNFNEVSRILNFAVNSNEKTWKKKTDKFLKKFMYFDKNNKTLLKKLSVISKNI